LSEIAPQGGVARKTFSAKFLLKNFPLFFFFGGGEKFIPASRAQLVVHVKIYAPRHSFDIIKKPSPP
jgi:hypothetical protein